MLLVSPREEQEPACLWLPLARAAHRPRSGRRDDGTTLDSSCRRPRTPREATKLAEPLACFTSSPVSDDSNGRSFGSFASMARGSKAARSRRRVETSHCKAQQVGRRPMIVIGPTENSDEWWCAGSVRSREEDFVLDARCIAAEMAGNQPVLRTGCQRFFQMSQRLRCKRCAARCVRACSDLLHMRRSQARGVGSDARPITH